MSFIQFESAREKDKAREELREARAQLLEHAKLRAEQRAQREAQEELRGEKNWMLPAVAKKLGGGSLGKRSKKSKKKKRKKDITKKSKKSKSKKKKRRQNSSEDESKTSDSEDTDSSSDSPASDSSSGSSSSPAKRSKKSAKKHKSRKKKKNKERSDNDDSECGEGGADEWVERKIDAKPATQIDSSLQRENWMTDSSLLLKTYTRERNEPKKNNEKQQPIEKYDPVKSTRELNPYWKSTGTGLPSFQRPHSDDDDEEVGNANRQRYYAKQASTNSRNWQKQPPNDERRQQQEKTESKKDVSPSSNSSNSDSETEPAVAEKKDQVAAPQQKDFLTDQQMNQLAAKALKAELKGDKQLAAELNAKLELARKNRSAMKDVIAKNAIEHRKGKPQQRIEHADVDDESHHELLTLTDERGNVRPLAQARHSKTVDPRDLYGGRRAQRKQNKRRVETHMDGERVRYFADDDRYDIKQMFEREKYASAADSNLQFADAMSKHKNPNDDLEDIFADKVRRNISDADNDKKEMQRAINEHQKFSAHLDNCEFCFDSRKLDKRCIVSMGVKFYLALPAYVGLQPGHCIIAPTQHVACITQLDEDAWEELNNFRKALTRMFAAQHKEVVFYEIANKLQRRPHLSVHCIPVAESKAEMAPFYFKKAIEESEQEWSVNKQLISLRNKSLRAAIPKGLPYVWVNFGMDSGFAHVIEDQDRFPRNFVQEILGGMLEISPSEWRKPQKEHNIISKVKLFADWWKKYDCTEQ